MKQTINMLFKSKTLSNTLVMEGWLNRGGKKGQGVPPFEDNASQGTNKNFCFVSVKL